MTTFRDRLHDAAFQAERQRVWKDRVKPFLQSEFRGIYDPVSGFGAKEFLAAYERAYFTGEVGDPQDRSSLSGSRVFAVLPFHCPEFWSEFFSTTWPQWERRGNFAQGLEGYCSIRNREYDLLGWSLDWEVEFHRYIYGMSYQPQLHVAGVTLANPFTLTDVFHAWAWAYDGVVRLGDTAPNKWTALYDYWLSVIPLVPKDCFEVCDVDSSGSSFHACGLLWDLANDRAAVEIQRLRMRINGNEERGDVLPDYDKMIRDPGRLALMARLVQDLESGALGPDLARLWDQVRQPGYHFWPAYRDGIPDLPLPPKARPRRGAGNPYLQGDVAVIDDLEDPFEMFADPDGPELGEHFRNAWKAVLSLAASDLGSFKVSGKRLGEEAYEVRIKTERHKHRFEYERGSGGEEIYQHLLEFAELEGLAGRFAIDRATREGEARVSYV